MPKNSNEKNNFSLKLLQNRCHYYQMVFVLIYILFLEVEFQYIPSASNTALCSCIHVCCACNNILSHSTLEFDPPFILPPDVSLKFCIKKPRLS